MDGISYSHELLTHARIHGISEKSGALRRPRMPLRASRPMIKKARYGFILPVSPFFDFPALSV